MSPRGDLHAGVFPASAGMIPDTELFGSPSQCVPRKRGDDPAAHPNGMPIDLCSPQARG